MGGLAPTDRLRHTVDVGIGIIIVHIVIGRDIAQFQRSRGGTKLECGTRGTQLLQRTEHHRRGLVRQDPLIVFRTVQIQVGIIGWITDDGTHFTAVTVRNDQRTGTGVQIDVRRGDLVVLDLHQKQGQIAQISLRVQFAGTIGIIQKLQIIAQQDEIMDTEQILGQDIGADQLFIRAVVPDRLQNGMDDDGQALLRRSESV